MGDSKKLLLPVKTLDALDACDADMRARILKALQKISDKRHEKEEARLKMTQLRKVQYMRDEDGDIWLKPEFDLFRHCEFGVYNVYYNHTSEEYYLHPVTLLTEALVEMRGTEGHTIRQKIEYFFSDECRARYKTMGLLHKRGVLLYGPPGTGKSTILNQVIATLRSHPNMMVLLNPDPDQVPDVIAQIREIEPHKTFIVVWEELENVVRSSESDLLGLLDGLKQVDNVLYMATTNHLEKLPPRIANRPSRFGDVIEIGLPTMSDRFDFLKAKLGDEQLAKQWAEKTSNMAIDHLKELIIAVRVFDTPVDVAIKRLKGLKIEG